MKILIRTFALIIGILTGYIIYLKFIKDGVLKPLCLLESNRCIQIQYYTISGTVLFNMLPTGYWCWYNGHTAYIYGITSGTFCSNSNFEPAYVIDLNSSTGKPKGYECIQSLKTLKKYYMENGNSDYIFYSSDKPEKTNIYDILNFLNNKNIISV